MQRFRDYIAFSVWHAGFSYMILWAMAFWALEHGARTFEQSGVCQPNHAQVLFYWTCEADSVWSILAALANTSLTLVVWAPVYIAAAFVWSDALLIAAPIILAHVVGLAAAILVTTRLALKLFARVRRVGSRRSAPMEALPGARAAIAPPPPVKARNQFGLRHARD